MMKTPDVRMSPSTDLMKDARSKAVVTLAAKHWRRWLVFVTGISAVVFVACLLLVPQSYKSTVSVAIVQPTDVTGGLSAAVGLGPTPNSKYVGVLQSRRFAEMVEDRIHLQKLYHLKDQADAIEVIMDNLAVKDSVKEGLIEVSLSLPGPPFLWPGGNIERTRVKQTAAQAMNLYADFLRDYMLHSNIDGDATMVKGADEQIQKARADYEAAVERLAQFVREKGAHMDAATMAMQLTGDGNAASSDGAPKDFVSLYMTRATLESDIQAATVALDSLKVKQADQLRNIDALPAEDPMLMKARADVSATKSEYEAMRLQFGPDNPKVTVAQDRLRIAQNVLEKQRQSVHLQRSTPWIDEQIKLQALQTRRSTIIHQIDEEEKKAKLGRDFMTEFARRRGEVMVRLEVLKAASADGAKLSLMTLAQSTKLAVVDPGIPDRKGMPRPGLMAVMSLFLSLFALVIWTLPEYARTVREVADSSYQNAETPDTLTQAA